MNTPRKTWSWWKFLLGALAAVLLLAAVYQIPYVNDRLSWRLDVLTTRVRMALSPAGALPAPQEHAQPLTAPSTAPSPSPSPSPTPAPARSTAAPSTPEPTAAPTATPTPLPGQVKLTSPRYEKQDWNNCGPATLSMALTYYGWEGDQFDVADEIKPARADRNINVDELAGFVRGSVPGINVVFRVGGTLDTLRLLLANGFPVVVEEGMHLQEAFWFEDDRWAGHYLLLTAYDDTTQAFTVQDSLEGADRSVRYTDLDANWQTFNRVFLVVYPSEAEDQVSALLGADWNADVNRQRALDTAQAETLSQPKNAFAWFNLGSNLVYFDRYAEAAQAYDRAREIGLPQRMLRYQFGPFLAYFHAGRTEDLLAISDFAVKITPNAEEALLWNGWARYRNGDRNGALARFQEALKAYPGYADAQYALNFLSQN